MFLKYKQSSLLYEGSYEKSCSNFSNFDLVSFCK